MDKNFEQKPIKRFSLYFIQECHFLFEKSKSYLPKELYNLFMDSSKKFFDLIENSPVSSEDKKEIWKCFKQAEELSLKFCQKMKVSQEENRDKIYSIALMANYICSSLLRLYRYNIKGAIRFLAKSKTLFEKGLFDDEEFYKNYHTYYTHCLDYSDFLIDLLLCYTILPDGDIPFDTESYY